MRKRAFILVAALAVAASASAAGPLMSGADGRATAGRTIGLAYPDPNGGAPLSSAIQPGATAAASALGDNLVVISSDSPGAVDSLIDQHVDAIVVNTDQGWDGITPMQPELEKARKAGIPTLSYEERFPGSLWIPQSTPDQYAKALSDSLASQMAGKGQYAIVSCRPAETIVTTWLKSVEAYVPARYPGMKRVAVAYGDTGNGDVDTHLFRRMIKRHPRLRGLIFLCPGESYNQPPQIVRAHKVGKVFSSGNGQLCPPVYIQYWRNVHSGAEQIVCAGDPYKLGYLAIWAADYLASGHTFAPGPYDVGGPIGTVHYLAHNQKLPLGQPITITQANLDQYPVER